ncbi:protein cereblon [Atheta coriaria]|uniref:protein cereblon n=1 Tax=Dalotia coriaria TaxID=877792 RepID=UPI0031F46EBE
MRDEEDDDEDDVGDSNDNGNTSSSENEEHTTRQRLLCEFDKNIPTTHEYLGKLDNISGYTLYENGQIIELPAVYTNTLVFPGFTLPLVLSYSDNSFEIGCNFILIWLIKDKKMFFEYGVVMEIFERSTQRGQMNIKARGRQRCFVLPQEMLMNPHRQIFKVKVRILEEAAITSPVSCTQLATLRQRHPYKGDYNNMAAFDRYRKMHLGQFVFPYWVYDLYEVDYYVDRIVKILSKYYAEDNIPKDPALLSFWFGQNFQLMNSERLTILQSNTTLERLQHALKYLNIERNLCCAHCDSLISHQKHVFAMSKDGLQSNYVNPGGVVYETVTVKKIQNYSLDGNACKEFSWFPGYAWTIIKCHECGGHLGWMFTAKNLQPNKFYGLARSCLSIRTNESGDEQENDDAPLIRPPPMALLANFFSLN